MLLADFLKFMFQLTIAAIVLRTLQGWLELNHPNSEWTKVVAYIY